MKTETSRFDVTDAVDGDEAIDVELIADSTDSILAMRMDSSTRADIDLKTTAVFGYLNQLLQEGLGADTDELVRQMFNKAYKLLDLKKRPKADTPVFAAFFYMREVAGLARRFLWIYSQRSGTGAA
ncbi:hypothetical protein ACFYNL_39315 [Streptomyces sp. NPDC007808]|uniref:hypothetical protein n=1 Tax=Streptomyces sp. NPDC007808 TaxID=3364779 RepID=UPI0036AB61B8